MDKADNKQSDVDNLQHKQDVLRAMDIIPGRPKGPSDKTKIHEKNHISSANASSKQQTSGIPKFDLAEEIMAEQRKITAVRRKAPGKNFETPRQQYEVESIGYAAMWSESAVREQEQIITEIVARDIEKLCGGDIIDAEV